MNVLQNLENWDKESIQALIDAVDPTLQGGSDYNPFSNVEDWDENAWNTLINKVDNTLPGGNGGINNLVNWDEPSLQNLINSVDPTLQGGSDYNSLANVENWDENAWANLINKVDNTLPGGNGGINNLENWDDESLQNLINSVDPTLPGGSGAINNIENWSPSGILDLLNSTPLPSFDPTAPEGKGWDAFNTGALERFNINNSVSSFDEGQLQGLRDQDATYQDGADKARIIREAALNTPYPSQGNNNGGINNSVDPTLPGGGTTPEATPLYTLNFGLTPESTNMDILQATIGLDRFDNPQDQERFQNWMAPDSQGNDASGGNDWANISNPTEYTLGLSDEQLTPANQVWFNQILDSIFTSTAPPNQAPPGYANPAPTGYAPTPNQTAMASTAPTAS
tara:strand:- start:888 stop:2078 length:1191 start_codon:yes stop_codon:yes gene_type:complete